MRKPTFNQFFWQGLFSFIPDDTVRNVLVGIAYGFVVVSAYQAGRNANKITYIPAGK